MRGIGFGRHHNAACVLVEPVHNARALFPANARQAVAAMRQQRINQRAVGAARGRMHHHICRFIDDQQIDILIQHVKRNVLRFHARVGGRRQGEGDNIILFDPPRRVFYGLVSLSPRDNAMAGLNQLLQPRA